MTKKTKSDFPSGRFNLLSVMSGDKRKKEIRDYKKQKHSNLCVTLHDSSNATYNFGSVQPPGGRPLCSHSADARFPISPPRDSELLTHCSNLRSTPPRLTAPLNELRGLTRVTAPPPNPALIETRYGAEGHEGVINWNIRAVIKLPSVAMTSGQSWRIGGGPVSNHRSGGTLSNRWRMRWNMQGFYETT